MYLRLRKIVVQRVTVIKFGMYYGGCNDTGRFAIKIRTDAASMTVRRTLLSMRFCDSDIWSIHVVIRLAFSQFDCFNRC